MLKVLKNSEALSEMCAEDNYQIIQEACAGVSCEQGRVNAGKNVQ